MKRIFLFLAVAVLMSALLTGCGNEVDETAAQDSLFEEETASDEPVDDNVIDLIDYSSYLKKIWVRQEWSSEDHGWSDSFVITQIENGHIEGYYAREGI